MTNEEKAKEIAENQFSWYSEFDDVTSYEECYESALEAMEWKEQQLIDKAVQFINNKLQGKRIEWKDEYCWCLECFIEQFRKAMKGE